MTDDELLALAREVIGEAFFGRADYVPKHKDIFIQQTYDGCVNMLTLHLRPLIKRHRAEVSNLTKQRDDWHAAADDWADKANELRADADAGREFMRAAWQEFNAIRARDGAPSGVSEAWWSELTDALDKLLGNDTVPWMLGAAKELVSPYATRAEKAEAEVERLTRERDEARAAMAGSTRGELLSALAAAQKRVGVLREALEGVCNYFSDWCYSSDDGCEAEQSANARYKARAALKESGNGDETVRPDQQGKSES